MPNHRFVGTLRSMLMVAALALLLLIPAAARAQSPVVQAVLFYSPSCPHCHQIILEYLPPVQDSYGDQLQIVFVDVTVEGGGQLYRSAIEAFEIPPERQGVPTMIVGDQVMVGSIEIPNRLPGLVDQGLASGGLPWPAIPGLAEALGIDPDESPAQGTTATGDEPTTPEGPAADGGSPPPELNGSVLDRIMRDPVGNGLSIVVLIGMIGCLGVAFGRWRQPKADKGNPGGEDRPADWLILLLVLGLFVAGYLTFVEMTQSTAVCGPVGDCNSVQSSRYARLFGVLPVGVLGVVGYLLMAVAWAAGRFAQRPTREVGSLVMAAMALFGTLFSIYLTFLEPFVIGATCAWCLSSAVIMTVLLLLTVRPARLAWERITR